MKEEPPQLLSLKEIIEKYPAEDYYSEIEHKGQKSPVFSRVHRNPEGKIVYIVPQSIKAIEAPSS